MEITEYGLINVKEIDERIEYLKKEIINNDSQWPTVKAMDEHELQILERLRQRAVTRENLETAFNTDGEYIEYLSDKCLKEIHEHTTLCINEHEEHIFLCGVNSGYHSAKKDVLDYQLRAQPVEKNSNIISDEEQEWMDSPMGHIAPAESTGSVFKKTMNLRLNGFCYPAVLEQMYECINTGKTEWRLVPHVFPDKTED